MMLKIITKVPYKERLYYDKDNEIYLKMLYKSIKSNKSIYFKTYVKLSEIITRFKGVKKG